jgi:DNA-binding MarR family transcriptional regulator
MPRHKAISELDPLSDADLTPVRVGEHPDLAAALNEVVTVANSLQLREMVIAGSRFPLAGDMPGFLLFNQLVYRGAARPTDIAEAIQTSRSNVSRIVTRLENAGLVRRTPDPDDDRALVIALTAQGREIGERILRLGTQLFAELLDEWTPDELAFLERMAFKLARTLSSAARIRSPRVPPKD